MPDPQPPVSPTWYARPQAIRIRVSHIEDGPFEDEVAVAIKIDGDTIYATVPSGALIRSEMSLHATKVGEIGDDILVALPPSSISRPSIRVPKTLESQLVLSH